MKFVTFLLTATFLTAASAACTDLIEPFYTKSYEVVRVEATAVLADPERTELKQEIEASVLEAGTVSPGGGYLIEYVAAFSGPLTIYPGEEIPALRGTFKELPSDNETSLVFQYNGRTDTCRLSTYNNEGEAQRVLLLFDYTELYRELYPDEGITSVVREEYTLTWAD